MIAIKTLIVSEMNPPAIYNPTPSLTSFTLIVSEMNPPAIYNFCYTLGQINTLIGMHTNQRSQRVRERERGLDKSIVIILLAIIALLLSAAFTGALYERSPVISNITLILVVITAVMVIIREIFFLTLKVIGLINTFREKKLRA